MKWMVVKRVLVGGGKNFVRGGAVSAATVLIMTVTLAIISSLVFLSALLSFTLNTIKDKVDVSVYFVTTASEQEILAVKDQLEKLPQVSSVTYTSAADALTAFRARHANDQLTLQALDQLGGNPLDASLEVRAKDPSEYESIVSFLEASPALSSDGTSLVDRINYAQNKDVIDRLSLAIQATREIGLAVVVLFAIASILIAFATIRLAIYTAKDEIAVMRLVGASNAYIQGPFIVAGIITGITAAATVLLLLWPATWYAGARTENWFGGFSLAGYYSSHFSIFFSILALSGILLGAFASVLAIRKYLRV
ncbi:permease-like cell division protein FtsX [Patescibacteria group bacterium]|nr:permease-like cell division protein FtsX [Patescibacteria group bacterium]MDE2021666.1 permease-like cell division protein FtsX [Patescibacteria group bacterium]